MNVWRYLHDVYGVDNFVASAVTSAFASGDAAPPVGLAVELDSSAFLFLTSENQQSFDDNYSPMFEKMTHAMGLKPGMYRVLYQKSTFVEGDAGTQILFDSQQTLGWQNENERRRLVVSSLSDLITNVEAKKRTWFLLKQSLLT